MVSTYRMLPYFAQSAHFRVLKQTNKQMDRQSDYSTPCAPVITIINLCVVSMYIHVRLLHTWYKYKQIVLSKRIQETRTQA